jgi:hypothetical protein
VLRVPTVLGGDDLVGDIVGLDLLLLPQLGDLERLRLVAPCRVAALVLFALDAAAALVAPPSCPA